MISFVVVHIKLLRDFIMLGDLTTLYETVYYNVCLPIISMLGPELA